MKKRRTLLIVLGVLVVVGAAMYGIGWLLFPESPTSVFTAHLHIPRPKPEVIIRIHLGSLDIPITNTAFSSFFAMLVLLIIVLLVRRGINRRSAEERIRNPRGAQNVAEWAIEYLINLLEGAAGKEHIKKRPLGRMIFPLVATLFIFIIFANWLSLVPGFSTILVRAPFTPVEAGAVTFNQLPAGEVCPGDKVTFEAVVEGATEPHYRWHINGEAQEEEEGWLDHTFREAGLVTIRLEAWNVDTRGERHGDTYMEQIRVLQGEEAEAAGCGERAPTTGAEHEEEHEPHALWFFGGDAHGTPAPLLRAPNSHLAITAGMAIIAVLVVQVLGTMKHGALGYLKHLATDAPGMMKGIMFPIHIISELSHIISLSARLFGNLYGGDVLLAVIFNLLAPLVPALFLGIEAFFYYIQALLFSVLTTVYIAMAVGGGHHEEEVQVPH